MLVLLLLAGAGCTKPPPSTAAAVCDQFEIEIPREIMPGDLEDYVFNLRFERQDPAGHWLSEDHASSRWIPGDDPSKLRLSVFGFGDFDRMTVDLNHGGDFLGRRSYLRKEMACGRPLSFVIEGWSPGF